MPKLDHIRLINAAGFDELEFPVSGHCQVIGVNGHGKSTLLRTVLFFYLGTNEKGPYALHENKSDFVSHYLGSPPSYLIYEVTRGDSQPGYHIVVTRPAGRIQFHFVDAPFRRDYYVDGKLVLAIEDVQERWREARCAFETLLSYEDFVHRIYGIVPSTYAVFRPAARSGEQVSVLPRIISGIFTVSQLDADKLKSALTCGVKSDALAAELDLVQLKQQLEHFRRVNRAVKTYVRHEQGATDLVELADSFDAVKADRQRAIEGLIRAAKLLPDETLRIEEALGVLRRERTRAEAEFERESKMLNDAITTLGNQIAVLDEQITQAVSIGVEYIRREIKRKAKEIDSLPQRKEEQRSARGEHSTLTSQFADESQRKSQLLANVRQGWAELNADFQKRRAESGEQFRGKFAQLDDEQATSRAKIADEETSTIRALATRRDNLAADRALLNKDLRQYAEITPPREIAEAEVRLKKIDQKQNQESTKLQQLRHERAIARDKAKTEREKLEREAESERTRIEAALAKSEGEITIATAELEAFDASLARFFQTKSPDSWLNAAKTLNRETLFHTTRALDAKTTTQPDNTVWGVSISTQNMSDASQDYDRAKLSARVRDLRKRLLTEKDALQAAHTRYVVDCDAQEKHSSQIASDLDAKIAASVEACGQFGDEAVRLENHLLDLHGQFKTFREQRHDSLNAREATWKAHEETLRKDEATVVEQFRSMLSRSDAEFKVRRQKLTEEERRTRSVIDQDEEVAAKKRDEEFLRIEQDSQRALSEKGANAERIAVAQARLNNATAEVQRIEKFRDEVAEYRQKKIEWMDRQPALESNRKTTADIQGVRRAALQQFCQHHGSAQAAFTEREDALNQTKRDLSKDQEALERFESDQRFLQEWGYSERTDLPKASFYQKGAVAEFLNSAENAHESREAIQKKGDTTAKTFLNRFDPETLDRKILGFSPIHEHFDWYYFVGAELKPFVNNFAIAGMKRIQTQEFEQLIRNISGKNAAFRDGIRQVNQTANSVQTHLAENNFVDVLEAIELRVERVDNQLTRTLEGLEKFAGISFGQDHDLFAKRADRGEIDRAIEQFERLIKEIDNYRSKQLSLTDYFEFSIRVKENGRDMGWRTTLNDIGSTGTDYLLKMLIYLSLIEVYRARAIDTKMKSTVHCVLDETGVLAPKYLRSVLAYAAAREIILITAGHSQQSAGFDYWMLVRKHGQRFGGQTVLRKILKCD